MLRSRLRADIESFKKAMPPQYPFVYGLEEEKEPSDLKVFVRGNPYSFGEDAPISAEGRHRIIQESNAAAISLRLRARGRERTFGPQSVRTRQSLFIRRGCSDLG